MLFIDGNLQADPNWQSNTSLDVNNPPSDSFTATLLPDSSLLVTNTGSADFAGGLVSNKRPLPSHNGQLLPYVGMRYRFIWDKATYDNLARHELDLKACLKTRPASDQKIYNVADWSTQWNRDTGQFQIDYQPDDPNDIPLWIDTGYVVQEIEPDVWHTLDYRMTFDYSNTVYSVLSIQLDNNTPYLIPEELQNVPLTLTNWEEIASVQLQNEMYKPGITQIQYSQVATLWSDTPIKQLPF
jgi:hypothetical protein